MDIDPTTALEFFQQPRVLSSSHDPNQWNGYRGDMTSGIQGGYRAYISGDKEPRCQKGRLRWGYAWNNEGDCNSPDGQMGIGRADEGTGCWGCNDDQRWASAALHGNNA